MRQKGWNLHQTESLTGLQGGSGDSAGRSQYSHRRKGSLVELHRCRSSFA